MNSPQLIYKGKFAHELTREEAIECALDFRRTHIESMLWHAKAERRMAKMAEALTPDQIKRLDCWLADHANDAKRGEGHDLWEDWQTYRMTHEGQLEPPLPRLKDVI